MSLILIGSSFWWGKVLPDMWASSSAEMSSGPIMGFPCRNYFCFGLLTHNVSLFLWFELSSLFTLSPPLLSGWSCYLWLWHRAVLQNSLGWQKCPLFVPLHTVTHCNLAASQNCVFLHNQIWNSLRSETVFNISFVFLLATQHMPGTWLPLPVYWMDK